MLWAEWKALSGMKEMFRLAEEEYEERKALCGMKEMFRLAEEEYEDKNKKSFPRPSYCRCVKFNFDKKECCNCWLSDITFETIYFRSLYIPHQLNTRGVINFEQELQLGDEFLISMKKNLHHCLALRGLVSEQKLLDAYHMKVLFDVEQMFAQHRLPPLSSEDERYFRAY